MATNYPASLDVFTNPASGNTLDSPSHSLQHSDLNDAVEAIETKLGAGAATPGTATALFPLVAGTAGATSWTRLTATGITSGTATSGQVLTANGSGAVSFNTPTAPGLVQIVPTSVAVGSGSGSVSATGAVTFTGASSVSINNCFSATYNNYLITLECNAGSGNYVNFRLRAAGTDATGSNYSWGFVNTTNGATAFQLAGSGATSSNITRPSASGRSITSFTIFNAPLAQETIWSGTLSYNDGATVAIAGAMGGIHAVSTAYDGFTLIHATSITGTVRIYGLSN
jgi:hypothetical protein